MKSQTPFQQKGGPWVLVQFLLMGWILWAGPVWRHEGAPVWHVALGWALIVPGAWVGIVGTWVLGPNRTAYPMPRQEGRLITHGIYAWIRHPLYSCLLLLGAGWASCWWSSAALAGTVVIAPFLSAKARLEERQLMEKFSDYRAYAERVPRFVPWPGRRWKAPEDQ